MFFYVIVLLICFCCCPVKPESHIFGPEIDLTWGAFGDIAVDPNTGDVWVAYYRGRIWTMRLSPTGEIIDSAAPALGTIGDGSSMNGHLAIAVRNNILHIVYNKNQSTLMYIHHSNGSWSDPVTIATTDRVLLPRIAVDSKNNAHMVFEYCDGVEKSAYIRYSFSGSTLSQLKIIGTSRSNEPNIGIDSMDKGHIVLFEGAYGSNGHWKGASYLSFQGSTFSGIEYAGNPPVDAGAGGTNIGMAVEKDGTVHIAYELMHTNLGYVIKRNDSWEQVQAITTITQNKSDNKAVVAVDHITKSICVVFEVDDLHYMLSLDNGNTFEAPRQLNTSSLGLGFRQGPKIANHNGRFYALWRASDNKLKMQILDFNSTLIQKNSNENKKSLLLQVSPNPFKSSVAFKFSIPSRQNASLRLYNLKGELVASLLAPEIRQGDYLIHWNGNGLNSGYFIAKFVIGKAIHYKKLLILK